MDAGLCHKTTMMVSEVIDELNVEPMLRKKIPGGGALRYHPVMFAKVFTYGYMNRTCPCRLVSKALRENVMYMWLSGNQKLR
jgi:transposase